MHTTTPLDLRLVALITVCALLVVNAFVLSPLWIFHPAELFTDTAAAPAYFVTMRLSWLLVSVLVLLLPALVRPGPRGAPAAWVLPLAQIAFAAQAATFFAQGFFVSWLLPIAPEVLNRTGLDRASVGLGLAWVLFLVANLVLAISLWRAGHSRIASVLMILGALGTPVFGPFGAGALALGLGLHAVRALRSDAPVQIPVPTAGTTRRTLMALLATCGVLAVNGVVLGPIWLTRTGEFSDTVAVPAYGTSQLISWALLTLLIVLLPALARLRTGKRPLPTWAVPVAQLALVVQATAHFVQAFMTPWLAEVAPELLDLTDGGLFMWMLQGIQVLFLILMVTFAATIWRAGHGKVAAALMMLGAIATPVAGPIGAGVLAIGLGLITARALRSEAGLAGVTSLLDAQQPLSGSGSRPVSR